MPNAQLLIFAGSNRQQSFNRKLAHATAAIARDAGASVTLLELSDFDIPLYNADLEAEGTPADVVRLKQALLDHPAWIICSPEYNGSYTGLLKNTIDWVSSPVKGHPEWSSGTRPFEGKVVGLLSASPGAGRPAIAEPPVAAAGQSGLLGGAEAVRAAARRRRL